MGLNEADTRAKLIDPAIHARGWTEELTRREETAGAIEIRMSLSLANCCLGQVVAGVHAQPGEFALDVVIAKILSESSGSAFPSIAAEKLERIEISMPLLDDQRRMASQLSEQMASADRLRKTLTEQLVAINKLPAALLRRAFRGEL